jgi:hypothetical protein
LNTWRKEHPKIRPVLVNADLREANLGVANLSQANLREAILSEANLTGCKIYAISAWNVSVEKTIQTGLVITRDTEATITVDNLEVAQFIYLLLNNQKIREVIDTIAKKAVLILGRFTLERKAILESQREYGMFEHFKKFPWVLQTYHYQDLEDLLASLQTMVIEPAEQKAKELENR